MASDYTIRTATRAEIDLAVDWAAAEGWNPGLHDADCFFAADPEGFLVGLLDGQPIATISVVRYGLHDGFLGFYIVQPEHRGQGRGLAIWQAGMHRLAGRNVGLDGVVAQQANYRKSGFALAWQNVRHEGSGGVGAMPEDTHLLRAAEVAFADLDAYDRRHFPAGRSGFLRSWISQPRSVTLVFVETGAIRGYGTLRPCRTGWKIGPLFADSPEIAEALFCALRAQAPASDRIYLDTPATHAHALELAHRHGMRPVFETARMYTGAFPAIPIERVYGITSFELG